MVKTNMVYLGKNAKHNDDNMHVWLSQYILQ